MKIKEWNSVKALAEDLKISKTAVYYACNGTRKSIKGFILKWAA